MDEREAIWRAGVAACLPERVVPQHLPEPPAGRTVVLALGKAATEMAGAVEGRWPGPLSGLAVAPHGSGGALCRIEVVTAAHPVPDEAGVEAARRLLALAREAGPDDLVLVLLSGGASALACLPGEGLALEEKRRLTGALLRSGADIGEINCVRRHLSRFKGGRLGLAVRPARLVTLAISDVLGDAPRDIGSGPTVPDPTSLDDARAVLRRYGIEAPAAGWSESAKAVPGDFRLVASGADALAAAAAEARRRGFDPVVLHARGEARLVGRAHAALALAAPPGTAIVSGGELTVTIRGQGRGGPNQEYALALALALDAAPGIAALAADTDGTDGGGGAATDPAGALVDATTLHRARERGLDAAALLAENDSTPFFETLNDLVSPGPTRTNVNDCRIILIG